MRNVVVSLALVAAMGCSSFMGDSPRTIGFNTENPWLEEPMLGAVEFWDAHGIPLRIAEQGQPNLLVTVQDMSEDIIGFCDCYDGRGIIAVSKTMEDKDLLDIKCLMSHEIGHAFGMMHVENASLMNPILHVDIVNDDCPWSDEDQAEFDRVVN